MTGGSKGRISDIHFFLLHIARDSIIRQVSHDIHISPCQYSSLMINDSRQDGFGSGKGVFSDMYASLLWLCYRPYLSNYLPHPSVIKDFRASAHSSWNLVYQVNIQIDKLSSDPIFLACCRLMDGLEHTRWVTVSINHPSTYSFLGSTNINLKLKFIASQTWIFWAGRLLSVAQTADIRRVLLKEIGSVKHDQTTMVHIYITKVGLLLCIVSPTLTWRASLTYLSKLSKK